MLFSALSLDFEQLTQSLSQFLQTSNDDNNTYLSDKKVVKCFFINVCKKVLDFIQKLYRPIFQVNIITASESFSFAEPV